MARKKLPVACACGVSCDTVELEMNHGVGCKSDHPHGEPPRYHIHCTPLSAAPTTCVGGCGKEMNGVGRICGDCFAPIKSLFSCLKCGKQSAECQCGT